MEDLPPFVPPPQMLEPSAFEPEPLPEEDPTQPFGEDDPFKECFGRMPRFSDEIGQEIFKKSEAWKTMVEGNGLFRQWRENFRLYHNAEPTGVTFGDRSFSVGGEQDSEVRIRFNEFRDLLTHILNMTTTQKVAMQSKATNSDPQSILAAQLYDGVLDYFISQWKRSRTNKQLRKAVELCLFMSNGYVLVEWDAAAGSDHVPDDNGGIMRTGDLYIKTRSVLDVYFDTNCEDEEELEWVVVRDFMSKFELAARYPDKQEEILALQSKTQEEKSIWGWSDETDLVPVYKTYWRSSQVLPKGRVVYSLAPDLVLIDMDNPYQDDAGQAVIPLLTVRASEGMGTLFGYSPGNDLAPVQQALNMIWSSVMTNEAAFGVGNISVERGSDIAVQSLAGGLNVIEYAEGKKPPAAFSVSSNESQSLNAITAVSQVGEKLSGVNSVVRGNPEDALKAASGRALGLIQAMAVQFQSALQASYQQLVMDFGNLLLLVVKRFAHAPQISKIVGKDRVLKLSSWTGQSFENVSGPVAEPINPLSKTIAGAREEAEFLVQQGLVTNIDDYYTVKTTGQIEPMIEDKISRNNLIAQENEQILQGIKPPILVTDAHPIHLQKHLVLADSPRVRTDSSIMQALLEHVQEHKDMEQQLQMQMQMAQQMPQPGQEQSGQPGETGQPGQPGQPGKGPPEPEGKEQHMMGPGGKPVPVPETAIVQPPNGAP